MVRAFLIKTVYTSLHADLPLASGDIWGLPYGKLIFASADAEGGVQYGQYFMQLVGRWT